MKKLLLLIPLLFLCGCGLKTEYGDFVIYNETTCDLRFQLSSDYKEFSEMTLYSKFTVTHYPIDCDYTLKVKNRKRPQDDWTTFIFHPTHKSTHYYVIGTDTVFKMSSSVFDGKSEEIKRIPPSTE